MNRKSRLAHTLPYAGREVSGVGANWGSLLLIVGALTVMYYRDPAFLMVERGNVVDLALVRRAAEEKNPRLLREILSRIGSGSVTQDVRLPYDEDVAPPDEPDIDETAGDESEISEINAWIREQQKR